MIKKQSMFKKALSKNQKNSLQIKQQSFPSSFKIQFEPKQATFLTKSQQYLNQQHCWVLNLQKNQIENQKVLARQKIMLQQNLVSVNKLNILFEQKQHINYALKYLSILPAVVQIKYQHNLQSCLKSSSITIRSQACNIIIGLYHRGMLQNKNAILMQCTKIIKQSKMEQSNQKALRLIIKQGKDQIHQYYEMIKQKEWNVNQYQNIVNKLILQGLDIKSSNFYQYPYLLYQNYVYIMHPLKNQFQHTQRICLYLQLLNHSELSQIAFDRLKDISHHIISNYTLQLNQLSTSIQLDLCSSFMGWELIVILGKLKCINSKYNHYFLITCPNILTQTHYQTMPVTPQWMSYQYRAYQLIQLFLTDHIYQFKQQYLYQYVQNVFQHVVRIDLKKGDIKRLCQQFIGGFGIYPFCLLFFRLFMIIDIEQQQMIVQQIFERYITLLCYSLKSNILLKIVKLDISLRKHFQLLSNMGKQFQQQYPFKQWIFQVNKLNFL